MMLNVVVVVVVVVVITCVHLEIFVSFAHYEIDFKFVA
jgi:hypothetical protein